MDTVPILSVDTDITESIRLGLDDMLVKLQEAQASGDMDKVVALLAQSHVKTEDDASKARTAKAEAVKAERLLMETDAKTLIDALAPEFLKVYQAENVEQRILALAERDTRISGFCYISEVTRTPASTVTEDDGTVTEVDATVSLSQPHGTLYKFVKRGATTSTSGNTTGESNGRGAPKPMTVSVNGVEREFANAQDARREYMPNTKGMSRLNVCKGINALDGHQVMNP